jgi:Ca2+/Na+ antiporter
MFACALGVSFALLGIPTASAITWNFNVPSGPLGTTQNYTVDGVTLAAGGFSSPAALFLLAWWRRRQKIA